MDILGRAIKPLLILATTFLCMSSFMSLAEVQNPDQRALGIDAQPTKAKYLTRRGYRYETDKVASETTAPAIVYSASRKRVKPNAPDSTADYLPAGDYQPLTRRGRAIAKKERVDAMMLGLN
jgi:hypothetical protein